MSSALSSELRTRFRECIEEGLSGRAAAARLKLSAATGVRWQRKWRETGAISPDVQGRPPGHGKLAAHQGLLEELVAQDGDITLPELAGALASATGVVAHAASIGRFLRKLLYTYKKVTGRDRTAARTGKTPTARMAAIPHPQNAGASRSDCVH